MSHRVLLSFLVCTLALMGCEPRQPESPSPDQEVLSGMEAMHAFFDNLQQLCGQEFTGHTEFMASPDPAFMDGPLVMHVSECTESDIRVPFHVGENRSRTWLFTRSEEGLLFKHDHRHEDGTPEDLTMYGGWATMDGTPYRQAFPADEETAEMLPEASTNVWYLEIDPYAKTFVYYLERHDEPRFRAAFDLDAPM